MSRLLVRADDGTEIPIVTDDDGSTVATCPTHGTMSDRGRGHFEDTVQFAVIHADNEHGS